MAQKNLKSNSTNNKLNPKVLMIIVNYQLNKWNKCIQKNLKKNKKKEKLKRKN